MSEIKVDEGDFDRLLCDGCGLYLTERHRHKAPCGAWCAFGIALVDLDEEAEYDVFIRDVRMGRIKTHTPPCCLPMDGHYFGSCPKGCFDGKPKFYCGDFAGREEDGSIS